jgi:hypothetical protein
MVDILMTPRRDADVKVEASRQILYSLCIYCTPLGGIFNPKPGSYINLCCHAARSHL